VTAIIEQLLALISGQTPQIIAARHEQPSAQLVSRPLAVDLDAGPEFEVSGSSSTLGSDDRETRNVKGTGVSGKIGWRSKLAETQAGRRKHHLRHFLSHPLR
jgi:hypothetical protein